MLQEFKQMYDMNQGTVGSLLTDLEKMNLPEDDATRISMMLNKYFDLEKFIWKLQIKGSMYATVDKLDSNIQSDLATSSTEKILEVFNWYSRVPLIRSEIDEILSMAGIDISEDSSNVLVKYLNEIQRAYAWFFERYTPVLQEAIIASAAKDMLHIYHDLLQIMMTMPSKEGVSRGNIAESLDEQDLSTQATSQLLQALAEAMTAKNQQGAMASAIFKSFGQR